MLNVIALVLIPAIIIISGLLYTAYYLLYTSAKGAPYVPTKTKHLKTALTIIKKAKNNEKAIDIGSGDGKAVIALAKHGYNVHGFEINPNLVALSKKRIKKHNLEETARIFTKNYWLHDISNYDLVYVYGLNRIMDKLEQKFISELKKGTKIVSIKYKFKNLKQIKEKDEVYLYEI